MQDKDTDTLIRLILRCLLFRLGGEQTFTIEEIDFICKDVKGIQVLRTEDHALLLRTRGTDAVLDALQKGVIL